MKGARRPLFGLVLPATATLAFTLVPMTGAWAQSPPGAAAGGRSLVVTPTASVSETLTNNALLNDADRRSDLITTATAGIALTSRSERLQGTLDYALSGSVHAKETAANDTRTSLRANLIAEVVDDWLFLNANATIGQSTISAFGVQSNDPAFNNPNRTEVRSFSVTPSLRGRLGPWASYSAFATHSQQSNATGEVGDLTNNSVTVNINSAGGSRMGWGIVASRQRDAYEAGRATTTESLRGSLSYAFNPEVRATVSAGRENSDLRESAGSGGGTWGLTLDWTPSNRTRLALQRDHRFLGDTHLISFDHRMARSVWRISSSKDVSTLKPSFANAGWVSFYDLLYANLAAIQPDPELRRQLVLQELARQGLDLNAGTSLGFLSSAVNLISRQDVSVAMQGLRTIVTMALFRSDTRRLDGSTSASDDLSNSPNVRQLGATVTVSHRLTPISSLSLSLAHQRTRGVSASQSNELNSINLGWTGQFGRSGDLSFGARHVEFDSTTIPYNESAVYATLRMRF